MDLSTFQLVDAINDMDMLRNLSDHQQQQQQQHQQQQQQQQQHQTYPQQQQNAYNQLHGDIDLLFQPNQNTNNNTNSPHINAYLPSANTPSSYKTVSQRSDQIMSSPHYRSNQHNECYEREDILTPLISPAMTPSFNNNYQQQKHNTMNFNGNDMDFSPLSSPAILPQMDRNNNNNNNRRYQQDQLPKDNSFEALSANQICEQYEQLEHAKLLITQKLSELQKSQRHNHNQYEDHRHGYQRSLLSSDSNSSRDSTSSIKNTMNMNNGDHMSIHHHHVLSKPNSPNRSPHMEPATPASLMNMKVNTTNTSKLQFSSSGRTQQQYYNNNTKPTTTSTAMTTASASSNNHVFQSPTMNTNPMDTTMISPMMTPTTTSTHHPAPLSPLALHPRNNTKQRSSSLKEKPSRFTKKQRRESSETKTSSTNIHASPRALKPLLISPTLNPGKQPLPSSITSSTAAVRSVEDAERILATRSNYQNLMEGKGAALGIAFSTQIKSGLEVRRTAHKAAEQKRRDSLKEWFDRLRREVEDGYVKRQKTLMSQVIKAQELEKNNNGKQKSHNTTDEEMEENTVVSDANVMKPLSKVLLLQYAYEYISSLKETLEEKDKTIEQLLSDKRKHTDDDEDDCVTEGGDV